VEVILPDTTGTALIQQIKAMQPTRTENPTIRFRPEELKRIRQAARLKDVYFTCIHSRHCVRESGRSDPRA